MSAFTPDRFYRVREINRESHAPRELVYSALRSGELKGIRRGRSWWVSGRAVTEWITRTDGSP